MRLKNKIQWSAGLIIILLINLAIACSSPENASSPIKPNIVLIVADDMGYGDLSCLGQQILRTPNIDEMAAKGILLTNHYTGSTVCAPSRASLITGKHPGHVSVRGNQPDQLLLDEEVTIAEKMKEAGYVTMAVGKWGIGHPPPPNDPERNGFDHFYGYVNMWHAHNFYPEFLYRDGKKEYLDNKLMTGENGESLWPKEPEGTGVAEVKNDYVHQLFDLEGLNFIEEHKDTSFFLYMAYNVPHANNEAGYMFNDGMEVPDYGEFETMDWPNPEKGFAMMMKNLDHSVGLLNSKLEELGLAENTLVIFVTDNGPHEEGNHSAEFFDSNGILRGTKRDLYEGGIRTPFIAKWDGKITPGSKSTHVSAFCDMMPTFCDLAGVSTPEESDGISMVPILLGNDEKQKKHPYLYFEFYEMGGKQAVLWENWKAVKLNVRTGDPILIELFNLAEVPSAITNVTDDHSYIGAAMQERMNESHVELPFMSLFDMEVNADTPF